LGEGSFFKASPETKVKNFPTRAAPFTCRVSPDSPEEWGHSQNKGPLCEVGVSQVQAQISGMLCSKGLAWNKGLINRSGFSVKVTLVPRNLMPIPKAQGFLIHNNNKKIN